MKTRLSEAQKRVMQWLGHGHEAYVGHDNAIYTNGVRLCAANTMAALEKKNLIEKAGRLSWVATREGRKITSELCL